MPFMQRLTWSGIALHQGNVPGYRASHGCIRLPGSFANSLFGFTERRTHVIVASANPTPEPLSHPTLFQPTPGPTTTEIPTPPQSTESGSLDQRQADGKRYAENLAGRTTATDASPATQSVRETSRAPSSNPLFAQDDLELAAHRQLMRSHKSDSPLRILITRGSERDRVRVAQDRLASIGYDPGPPDGYIGKQSVIAIRAFQKEEGLVATGYPNKEFYEALSRKVGAQSEPTAYIYVRQDQKDIYQAPIQLKDPDAPLGAHLFLVTAFDKTSGHANWHATTVKSGGYSWKVPKVPTSGSETPSDLGDATAQSVLNRIILPAHVRLRIEDAMTAKSSLIIADGGHARETGKDTDFIVLTR